MTDLDKWQLRPITVWLEFRTAQTERDSPSGKKGLIVFTVLMRRWLNKLKQEKRNGTFICSAAGARSPPIGFLDDSLLLKRVIYVPLSSLSRGDGWSGSLILAGSRGLYLWWHINWALPVKKRKATVPTGLALFAEPQKLVLFGWRSFWLFIYTAECFKMACFLSLCARLHAHYAVFARLCTGQLYGSRWHVGDNDLGWWESGSREWVSVAVSSARLPLEFPCGALSSPSIIDHIHLHQLLQLITTPIWISKEKREESLCFSQLLPSKERYDTGVRVCATICLTVS